MTYNVLWIDDEYKTRGTSFITLAEQDDIIIEAVESHEEGMAKLKEKEGFYDAVILDAKVKLNKADTTTNLKGLSASRDFLIAYNKDKILPYFIYTGQPDYQKNDIFEDSYGKYYIKGTDNEQLLEDIKKEVENIEIRRVKKKYSDIFEIFDLGYLPDSVEENILDLLIKSLPKNNSGLKGVLTNIRSIQESCFVQLENIRVIPNSKDSFNKILKHLSGNISKDRGYKPVTNVYQTIEIENLQKWIYFTCGRYIHYLEEQHNDGYMISNYAVESLRNGLLEILLWFKETYKENI
ncbi:hypothetical protein [Tenacibaculum piscium]|uniref:hypothetical protein n=1 Tax=Tenacibaculum piscium TaxID=1458515 RepID=UPI001EFBC4B9|nr:hypothetical protein [Tenacibaculum piscium]MCG8182758.1 hypothetical protein [Tenacibaculum piscium]MCG8204150.1 hypothetical protein [Tenacibaculum piscium]